RGPGATSASTGPPPRTRSPASIPSRVVVSPSGTARRSARSGCPPTPPPPSASPPASSSPKSSTGAAPAACTWTLPEEAPMGDYEDTVRILEVELGQVEQAFPALSHVDWRTPTKRRPLDEAKAPWTLFELAGHFDISIGLTVMLVGEPQDGQAGRATGGLL